MHHPGLTRLAVVGVVSASVLAVGCGDSDSADRSERPTQAPAAYRAQAARLCEQAARGMSQAAPPNTFPAQLEDYDKGSKAMLEAIELPYARLAALPAPEGLVGAHERFAAELRGAIADAKTLRRLVAERNDDTDALALAKTDVVTHTGNAMDAAATLGLDACSNLAFKEG